MRDAVREQLLAVPAEVTHVVVRRLFELAEQERKVDERDALLLQALTFRAQERIPALAAHDPGFRRAAARVREAVVIGGGLLGLEAANGLRQRGMNVTVVHLMPWLMERQLDARAAGMLQGALEKRGIRFMLGAQTITGVNNHKVTALPHDRLREVLRKYNRLP